MRFRILFYDAATPEAEQTEILQLSMGFCPAYTVGDEIYIARSGDITGMWRVVNYVHYACPELQLYQLEVTIKRKRSKSLINTLITKTWQFITRPKKST